MRDKLLSFGIVVTPFSIVVFLLYAHVTDFTGYTTSYCHSFTFTKVASAHGEQDISPDQKRVMDLLQLVIQLKNYHAKNGRYPVHTDVTNVADVDKLLAVPPDPCQAINTAYGYQYVSDSLGQDFLLRTLLSDSGYRYVHAQYPFAREAWSLGVWCGEGIHKRILCFGPESVSDQKPANHANHNARRRQTTDLPMTIHVSTTTVPNQLHVTTTGFTFAETLVDTKHIDGYGHAHVYINGTKIGRVYEENVILPALSPGVYEVKVILNTNDHQVYLYNNQAVSDTIQVFISE